MSFHTVAEFVSGLPLAMGLCGALFGRWMKSAECAWGMGAPLRTPLIKSTITVNWASSNCPNSRYSSRSWYGTMAAALWMMARRFPMVAWGGGPSGAPVHPVIARTRVRESAPSGARCRWRSWSNATAAFWWSGTGTPTT